MTSVLVVEDHTLVRESLVKLIQSEGGLEVVADTGSAGQVLDLIAEHDPDIVVLDIDLGGDDGLTLAAKLREAGDRRPIIFLTMHEGDAYLRRAMGVGAAGYVPKASSTDELLQALHVVREGGTYLSPSLTRRALDLASGRAEGPVGSLTDRELEILLALAEGARPGEIATQLFISVKTVKNHLTSIYAKLGVESGAQAVAEAYRLGLTSPSS